MDTLSPLMQLARPQAQLDVRCTLAASNLLPHEAAQAGLMPFHLVLAGQCRVRLTHTTTNKPSTERLLQAGDWLLLPEGSAHDLEVIAGPNSPPSGLSTDATGWLPRRHDGDSPWALDVLCGHFSHDGGAMHELLRGLPPLWVVPLPEIVGTAQTLPVLTQWLRDETLTDLPGARALVTALCQALLTLALRHTMTQASPPPGTLALLGHARLGPAVQAMLNQPGHPWTLDTLAQRCALSRASLARHFARVGGQAPLTWLTAWRMALAHEALRNSQRSVADIAQTLGYGSAAALVRPFRQHFGVSPAHCRKDRQISID